MWKTVPDSATKGDPDAPLIIMGGPTMGKTASCASPFVEKVEVFCRMAGIPYQGGKLDFKHAPKGKVPYIRHGDVVLGDSTFILEYLRGTYGDRIQLAQPTSAEEKAEMVACQRICDDHLYFILLHYRWRTDKVLESVMQLFGSEIIGKEHEGYAANCGILRPFLSWFRSMTFPPHFRKRIAAQLQAQGLGRHSVNDLNKLMRSSVEALSTFLGKRKYYGGSEPSDTDAIVFSCIDVFLYDGLELEHTKIIREFDNLVEYCDRMRQEFFPEDNPSVFRKSVAEMEA